ncbi:MAG TPA: DUF2254 family protein [Chthoniobacterales bacterium]
MRDPVSRCGKLEACATFTCTEWLGAALIRLAQRQIPSRRSYDDAGRLRVITDATDFEGIANAALNQLRQYGCKSVAVTVRLLDVLARVGPRLVRQRDREILLGHARAIRDDGLASKPNERDEEDVRKFYEKAAAALRPQSPDQA